MESATSTHAPLPPFGGGGRLVRRCVDVAIGAKLDGWGDYEQCGDVAANVAFVVGGAIVGMDDDAVRFVHASIIPPMRVGVKDYFCLVIPP